MTTILATALNYRACGLSVIPVKPDGSKSPAILEWKSFQSALASERQLEDWFRNGHNGIAIIGGGVSGGLEVLDIETQDTAERWQKRVLELGGKDILQKLVIVKTPKPGYHCYYRCEQPGPNTDLARRPATPEEHSANPKQKYYKLIETRGEKGYALAPGSPARCHPNNVEYRIVRGGFEKLPTVTMAERELLFEAARSLNEWFKEYVAPQPQSESTGDQPGDLFESKATWSQILQPKGWREEAPGRWIRPGGKRASAMEILGGKKLWCFSSSVTELPFEQALSKFATYAMIHHGGDFAKAAKQLASDGYKSTPAPKKKEVIDCSPDAEDYSLQTMQLADLMSAHFEPPRWAIEDLLPEGLTILAGPPKLGKSWMALDIAIAITLGEPIFGNYQTSQGEALYLALEDNHRRLQQRINVIADDSKTVNNRRLHLCTKISGMVHGGVVALEEWLEEHPECRLVIIDTVAKFLPPNENKANAYQAEYQALGRLQELALKHRIALVVVHHVRKMKASDQLDEVSGSAAFTGAADAIWVLKRARTENTGTLLVTGRDVDEMQLVAEFDKETCRWNLQGDARHEARRKVLIALYGHFSSEPFTFATAREPLGVSLAHAKRIIGALQSNGYVQRSDEKVGKAFQFTLTERVPEVLLAGGAE
jgi:hypothetical protein